MLRVGRRPRARAAATVAVVSAGTSDLPVAEEAALTAESTGCRVDRIVDVVRPVREPGIHPLFQSVFIFESAVTLAGDTSDVRFWRQDLGHVRSAHWDLERCLRMSENGDLGGYVGYRSAWLGDVDVEGLPVNDLAVGSDNWSAEPTPDVHGYTVIVLGVIAAAVFHLAGYALHLYRARFLVGSFDEVIALAGAWIASTVVAISIMKREGLPEDRGVLLEEVREYLAREHGIVLVAALGFENTYALAMREAQAAELGVRAISQLRSHAPHLDIGGDYEFFQRAEWAALVRVYELAFRNERSMDAAKQAGVEQLVDRQKDRLMEKGKEKLEEKLKDIFDRD